jgi:uncharacterized protein (UPF0332 family)
MTREEAKREAARLWMEKADDALRAAKRERELSPASSLNRAYYACFYAATAVLIREGRQFVKHSGVRSALHRYLIRPGRLPKDLGDSYDRLMSVRQKADYEAVVSWTPEHAAEAIEVAERLVTALRALLPAGYNG